jgi:3-dehydroquinate synthase
MDVRVNLGPRGYDIAVRSGAAAEFVPFVRQRTRSRRAFVVTDHNARRHAEPLAAMLTADGFRVDLVPLPPGEDQKSLESASHLYDVLAAGRADRMALVVAAGGGVVGDLAGFAAATWARGVPLLMVPTTLLAMVDSSVGGKVGVNHAAGKNLIGAFHQPVGVWIDTAYLDTLPPREYRSGLAEVVKYGVILDPELFIDLENHADEILRRDPAAVRRLVARCCRLKADVVERDEREETGLRAVLNYGHTFAHAFEAVGGYGAWLHGEAVAAGMVCASRLAERRKLIDHATTERQRELLEEFQLPTAPKRWDVGRLLDAMRGDKKAVAGRLRFVLPRRLGEVALFDDVPEEDVRAVLEEMIPAGEGMG